MNSEVLTDIRTFLKDTLAKEQLSCSAEKERLRLMNLLGTRESSPAPYLDMNPTNKCNGMKELNDDNNQCYEELSDTTSSLTSDFILAEKNERNRIEDLNGSFYNNIPNVFISSPYWETDIERRLIPSHALVNFGVHWYHICLSFVKESRNSVCSLSASQCGKGSADGTESSGSVSGSSSSLAGSSFGGSATPATRSTTDGVLAVSASVLRYTATKCGPLSRKEKFLFLDHHKQYWAALVGRLLYVYSSEKDSKPVVEINVENYQARPVATKESTKKDCSFEIFCPGNKTYQFTVASHMEMDQWVAAICQAGKVESTATNMCSISPQKRLSDPLTQTESSSSSCARQLPSIPVENKVQAYDMPDARTRPVAPPAPEQYEMMNSDAYYHCIDNGTINQGVLYRNVEDVDNRESSTYANDDENDENFYYNVVSTDQDESFYDTIPGVTEKKLMLERELQLKYLQEQQLILDQQQDQNEVNSPDEKDYEILKQAIPHDQVQSKKHENVGSDETSKDKPAQKLTNTEIRTGPVSGRIQQIIQRIEEAAGTTVKTQKIIVQNSFYEPVETNEQITHSRTISR